jgi:YfiH family protein
MAQRIPRAGAVADVDLGGGFISAARPDGGTVIAATALNGTGAAGFVSPIDVDGRLDAGARAWLDRLGVDRSRLRSLDQQHGAVVVKAMWSRTFRSYVHPKADGIWTDSREDVLAVRTADCAAMWIVDPRNRRLCMIHAGWSGAALGVVLAGVRALAVAGGDPRDFVAAVGPHLGRCCFEVGPEVAAAFEGIEGAVLPATGLLAPRMRADSSALDFSVVVAHALGQSGLAPEAVHVATTCTRCHPELLHSYRRNGPGGPLTVSIGMLAS